MLIEVIGIAATVVVNQVGEDPAPMIYRPIQQDYPAGHRQSNWLYNEDLRKGNFKPAVEWAFLKAAVWPDWRGSE